MRGFSIPNEKSVSKTILERASQKFQPVDPVKREASALPTVKEQRENDANKLKSLAQRDELTPRGYTLNAPGNVSFTPSRKRDNRGEVIAASSRVLEAALSDKIGRGGVSIELATNGFKPLASERTKLSDDDYSIMRARSIFAVKIDTPHPNVKRQIVAAVEFDSSAEKTAQYKLSEFVVDTETQGKIAFNTESLNDFVKTGKSRAESRTRTASRHENTAENPNDFKRKLVVCRFDGPIAKFMEVKVNDIGNSVNLLKTAGFDIQKRVFDVTHGDVQGPVYEIVATTAQLKKIDAMLREAGEFTEIDRKPHNDEAPNSKSGETFKNEDQIDDAKKWPGRSDEKNGPSYMKATPKDMSKDSEGKAEDFELYDKANSFPGRASEKNREGLPAKPEYKPHGDEKPNKEGQNPNMPGPSSDESPKDWPNRSLETGTSIGVGEMLRYESYRKIRDAKLTFAGAPMAVTSPAPSMSMPLGGSAQAAPAPAPAMPAPAETANDEIGQLADSPDVDVMKDEEGKVVLVVPKDKLIDLAGGLSEKSAPAPKPAPSPAANMPTPATTPDNQGLPGSIQASKKQAESVPMPNGGSSKFQKAPDVPKSSSKMDGMSHGKSSGGSPDVVPTEEFKKYKAVAFTLAFPEANAAFAAAQRIAIKANEYRLCTEASKNGPVLVRPLSQNEFAQTTRVAAMMVGKRTAQANPYVVTTEHLLREKDNPYASVILNSLRTEAQADGTAAPNSAPPKSKGEADSMDGLDHGKSDEKNKEGYKASSEQQAKEDVIGGINKNPEKPNISNKHDSMDGMNHGKSDGGGEKVKPSSDYNKANPVKHMARYEGENRIAPIGRGEYHDFREQLLGALSKQGGIKAPFKVFASIHTEVDQDIKASRTDLMDRYARHEVSDTFVTTELKKIEALAKARKEQITLARKHVAAKIKKAQAKPTSHFSVPDTKNEYNHQDDDWWNRSLETSGGKPQGGMPDQSLKADEGKARDFEMYDDANKFPGRSVEKTGGIPASGPKPVKSDEDKAFGHEGMYDDSKSWVGRASQTDWKAPTSYEYMMKSERKKEIEGALSRYSLAVKDNDKDFDKIVAAMLNSAESKDTKYCFGTRNAEVVKQVINYKLGALKEHEITYAISKQFPNSLANVPDIIASYEEITANPKSPAGIASGSSKQAAGKEDFNKSSYEEEKNDKIAVEMPEQKSWQKGDSSKADKNLGRSDQPGDLKKDQKPQPTIMSEEENHPVENNKKDGAVKNAAGANPWAVCHTTVDKDANPEKYEKCVKDVKKKNVEKGAPAEGDKKKAQTNQDVLPKEQRDLGKEMQHGMVTHHEQPGNNVSFGANDNVYDNSGRFGKKDPASPYSVAHIVERVLIGLKNRDYENAQAALDGIAVGEAFKRVSQGQLRLITEALKANGFDVKEPKAREYKEPVDKR